MTLSVEIRFPLGRYHATPWDRHVNEGAIEWPPSPWRLARALYAVWQERCPHLDRADVIAALEAISGSPSYRIPRWQSSASRHYYPANDHRPPQKISTDKVVDAFVSVAPSTPLVLVWEGVSLEGGPRSSLAELIGALPFLGRADSVCEANLVEAPAADTPCQVIRPDEDGGLRVAVPVRPLDLDELTITTDAMRKARLRQPMGMTHVLYPEPVPDTRPADGAPPRAAPTITADAFVFAVSGRPAPSHLLTVAVAETFLNGAQSRYEKLTGSRPPPVFTGHVPEGRERRTDQHRHAHVFGLPDPSGSGNISRLVVWAKEGFGPTEAAVLGQLTQLRLAKRQQGAGADAGGRPIIRGFGPTRILLTQLGAVTAVAPEIARPATRWTSITPFVPSRHQKHRRFDGDRTGPYFLDFLTDEIQRELAYRSFEAEVLGSVRVVADSERASPAQRFRRYRLKHGMNSARAAVWLEFDLNQEVDGPIALGALSHFGLGLFGPC